MILTKLVRNFIDMMAVAVIFFLIFYGPASFLIIRQNVCMSATAIMHCGLNRVVSRRVTSAFKDPIATTRFADYSSVRRLDGFTRASLRCVCVSYFAAHAAVRDGRVWTYLIAA